MKRTLQTMFLVATAIVASDALATVRTVSNNPNRPAQFTTIQAAVTASSPNDTILITGGTYWGESINVVIPLVFYGEAISSTPEFPETILYACSINFGRLNSSLSASGSRMYGIRMYQGGVTINGNFSGTDPGQGNGTPMLAFDGNFNQAIE